VREKAEKGISDYQFILGRFSLSKVRGTEEKEALNWFEKANAQGHSDSCYFIFRIYQLQKDEINMEKYLKKIEENSPILAYLLKEIHFPLSKRL
jgi:TPR repeat protein